MAVGATQMYANPLFSLTFMLIYPKKLNLPYENYFRPMSPFYVSAKMASNSSVYTLDKNACWGCHPKPGIIGQNLPDKVAAFSLVFAVVTAEIFGSLRRP